MRDHRNERILQIDDDDRGFAFGDALQIIDEKIADRIGLAVAGAANDPVVLEAGSLRDFEGDRQR